MNDQNLVSVLSASASTDNTDLGFDNSRYHVQPHPIIAYCHLALWVIVSVQQLFYSLSITTRGLCNGLKPYELLSGSIS